MKRVAWPFWNHKRITHRYVVVVTLRMFLKVAVDPMADRLTCYVGHDTLQPYIFAAYNHRCVGMVMMSGSARRRVSVLPASPYIPQLILQVEM